MNNTENTSQINQPIPTEATPEKETFKTDDVNFASFIKARGGILLDIGILSGSAFMKRYYFEFEDVEFCEKLKLNYMNGEDDQVSAKALIEARDMFIKKVKSLSMGFQ